MARRRVEARTRMQGRSVEELLRAYKDEEDEVVLPEGEYLLKIVSVTVGNTAMRPVAPGRD